MKVKILQNMNDEAKCVKCIYEESKDFMVNVSVHQNSEKFVFVFVSNGWAYERCLRWNILVYDVVLVNENANMLENKIGKRYCKKMNRKYIELQWNF